MIRRFLSFLLKIALLIFIVLLPYMVAKYPQGVCTLYELAFARIEGLYTLIQEIITGGTL